MVVRFFLYIWGAMLVMMALVALAIHIMDWGPPEALAQADMVQRALSRIEAAGGDTRATWQTMQAGYPDLALVEDPGCSAIAPVSDGAGGCLKVEMTGNGPSLLANSPLWAALSLGALSSALAAIGLTQWLMTPVRAVSRALKDLAGGAFSTRIPPKLRTRNRELSELAQSFDDAASQLEELAESRRRLLHDISHEIRSPLARLRAAIELLEVSPERRESMLAQMSTDITRMDQLINEILTLTRLDRYHAPKADPLDLMDILEPILSDANFEGEERGISVGYDGPDALPVTGDAELLHRTLENVIRNALNHAPEGTAVTVIARIPPEGPTIDVSDRGPGVPEADLERMFKPFVKLGASPRSTGFGLGLAIAARGVQMNGGSIHALRRDGGGLTIRITLPLGRPVPPA